ncbi:hypothetical protein Tco_0323850 [Tanacetum coccineum]
MLLWASSNYRESSTAARTAAPAFAGDLKPVDAMTSTFLYFFVRYTLTKWYQVPGYDKKLAEDGKIKVDKFHGHDFRFWKIKIKDYLYQKKLHEHLAEAKPTGMKANDWTLLDRQALSVVRLSLGKNIKEGASVADHVNEFNSILSSLMLVDIKFNDEVHTLLLLSSLPESRSDTVIAVSGSTGTTKLNFDNIRDLILGEDICRKTSGEYSNSLLSAKDKGMGRKQERGQKQNRSRSKSKKRARDYDDALVSCVENMIDDRIMNSGASFHATYWKEEFERFKIRSSKVRLVDDKTLDIAGVGGVVLKTSFGTSWNLKDVKYIPDLKKRLISVRQLDDEGSRKVWVYFLKNKSEVFNIFKKWKVTMENETNLRVKFLKSDMVDSIVAESSLRKEVSLAQFRVFGCDSHIKVKDVAKDKLDAKSMKCTFIGYGSDEMGYRFWDSKGHKVVQRFVFRFPPYQLASPEKKLTMDKILAKFINEGKREHEEMEIFIREFRTTNELY